MKKFVLLTLICFLSVGLKAQQYLDFSDRAPEYHYSDTNWVDHYFLYHEGDTCFWQRFSMGNNYGKPEVARYCYTDTSINVIGIAACLFIDPRGSGPVIPQEQNYFRLYEVQRGTGEMLLLNQAPFVYDPDEEVATRYNINLSYNPYAPDHKMWFPVYEAYFEKPEIVNDSFYISVTCFNNHRREILETTTYKLFVYTLCAHSTTWPYPVIEDYGFKPPYCKMKQHDPIDALNDDIGWVFSDTNWHVIDNWGEPEGRDLIDYLVMFPIIDTSYRAPRNLCSAPGNLTVNPVGGGELLFSWEDNGAERWELSILTNEFLNTEVMRLYCDSTVAKVTGLDSTRNYKARLRSICSDGDTSLWGRPMEFHGSGTTGGSTEIETAVDRYTYVVPNPASDIVMVASSYRITHVEVFTMGGQRLDTVVVDGLSVNIDISTYATGTYLLRIHTNNGSATKKLVIK